MQACHASIWHYRESQKSKEKIEGVLGQTFIFEADQKINCCKNQYSVLKIRDSVREHQPGVSYLPTIPFRSTNPEPRIFLRFRSGASIWSLACSYDSVRENQPGVSYLPTIPFGSVNPESRIFYDSIQQRLPESRIFLTILFKKCDNL